MVSIVFKSLFIGILLCLSSVCFADVVITEIMYDPEGADTKREWIEILNTGTEALDIGEWYFFENQVNHGLVPQDFQYLEPNARAIIVQDVPTFHTEFGDTLLVIKSSFSLNNTGEELALSNPAKEVIHSVVYTSEWGAQGNGMSLQLIDADWGQAYPTPGEESSEFIEEGDDEENSSETSSEQEKKKPIETYKAFIETPISLVARSSFPMEAYVEHTYDKKKKTLKGYYQLAMGDGTLIEGDNPLAFSYYYSYTGNYEIVLEYYSSKLAFEAGVDPIATLSKKVRVVDSSLEIINVDVETNIHIKNNTTSRVDLSGWKLFSRDSSFTIPRNTFLESSGTLVVPYRVHNIHLAGSQKFINLATNQGITISTFLPYHTEKVILMSSEDLTLSNIEENEEYTLDQTDIYLSQNPDKIRVSFYEGDNNSPVSASSSENTLRMYAVYAACASLVLVGVRILLRKYYKHYETRSSSLLNDEVEGDIELR